MELVRMDLQRKLSAAYVPVVLEESYARKVRYMGNKKVNVIYASFLVSKKKNQPFSDDKE